MKKLYLRLYTITYNLKSTFMTKINGGIGEKVALFATVGLAEV